MIIGWIMEFHFDSQSSSTLRTLSLPIFQSGPINDRRGKKNLVLSAWGDDSLLSEDCINPYYSSSSYQSYSEQTRQNLVNAFKMLILTTLS
jgi:ATP-dependent RNA helicase DHX29